MTRRYLKLAIVGSIFTLSACAQQSEIRQMNQSVSTLSKEMTQLNQQTVKITQQNALNAKSSSGVYLLPAPKPRRASKARSAPCACRCSISPPMPTVPA
jgi:TolA-binding protein